MKGIPPHTHATHDNGFGNSGGGGENMKVAILNEHLPKYSTTLAVDCCYKNFFKSFANDYFIVVGI